MLPSNEDQNRMKGQWFGMLVVIIDGLSCLLSCKCFNLSLPLMANALVTID